jgi:hypothetical protein
MFRTVRNFFAIVGFIFSLIALSSPAWADPITTVFVIAMENTNWSQNANQFTGSQQQILNNPAAPFLNGLVNGTLTTTVNGKTITSQTAYASAYHNVLSTPSGNNPSIHPSEPNYIWSEAGDNLGVTNDNQPFGAGGTNQNTTLHLSGFLQNAGVSWKSYQEDTDLAGSGSTKTSTVLPQSQWTVPLNNLSGTSPLYVNPYNGSNQYDYAAKHCPTCFFTDTNGGNDPTPSNPLSANYAPLQQLQNDLNNNTVAQYNWITPDQFNDMHTGLAGSFTYNGTTYLNNSTQSGAEKIAQGDNFLSQIVPMIMASQAYQNNGAIVLWWDESEPDGTGNQNDFNHTIPEIVISPLAHPNFNGTPFNSTANLTHSADLRTMEEIFGVYPYLRDAATSPDLASLFAAGAIPTPEPTTLMTLLMGLSVAAGTLVRRVGQ